MPKIEKDVTSSLDVTSAQANHQGLCMNCIHAPVCVYRLNSGPAILECNEFDDRVAQPPESSGESMTRLQVQSSIEVKDAAKFMGLCVNCASRETCTFNKPEGGVWHCEEYR